MVVYKSRDASTDGSTVAKRSRFNNAAEYALMKLDDVVNWARAVCVCIHVHVHVIHILRVLCGQ